MIIYHVAFAEAWEEGLQKGAYSSASLSSEGFIHCCSDEQLEGVLNRYYQGKTGLVKLVIDTTLLTSDLKTELAPSVNDYFPHIYGPINPGAVIDQVAIN